MDGDHKADTDCTITPAKTSVLGLKFGNKISELHIDSNGSWSKLETQLSYLSTPPTSFIILSKPGLGEKYLGDSLAEYWNCIHINPDDVIQEQIDLKSDCGRCIEFNLRCGKVVTIDIILQLIDGIMNSDVVKHRGYVLSGIPLVETYRSSDCCNYLYSEEAFLTIEELLSDFMTNIELNSVDKSIAGENSEAEDIDEDVDHLSNLGSMDEEHANVNSENIVEYRTKLSGILLLKEDRGCCKRTTLKDQTDFIIKLKNAPTVIIHISCPKEDIITLRGQNVFLYPMCNNLQIPFDCENAIDDFKKNTNPPDVFVYQCWRPSNFSHFVEAQLKKMNRQFKSAIKRYIILHDPQCVITLDGRQTRQTNLEVVKSKLSNLTLSRVILPIPYKIFEKGNNQEDDEENINEVENNDEISRNAFLQNFEDNRKLNPLFPYSESLWRTKCPVALIEGKAVVGSPEYAVIFFDHLFLLSNAEALSSFCRNPRPYLNLEYLTPTCRIVIVGTKKSGKSTLAKCLSWLFNGVIIDVQRLERKILKERELAILNETYPEALEELTILQEQLWQERNALRIIALEEWKQEKIIIVEKYAELDEAEMQELLLTFHHSSSHIMPDSESKINSEDASDITPGDASEIVSKNASSIVTVENILPDIISIVLQDVPSTVIPDVASSVAPDTASKQSSKKSKSKSSSHSSTSKRSRKSSMKSGRISTILEEKISSEVIPLSESVQWFVDIFRDVIVDENMFMEFCESSIEEPDSLLQYAPSHLLTTSIHIPTEEEIIERAKEIIREENKYDDIVISDEDIVNSVIQQIQIIDNKMNSYTQGLKKFGKWIIDGFSCQTHFWEALKNHNCLPDDVICLTENTNIDLELFLRHKSKRQNERSLGGIFDRMDEPLLEVHQDLLQYNSKASIMSELSRIITALLENDYFEDNKLRHVPSDMTAESLQALQNSELQIFFEEVKNFNEGFVVLKTLLESYFIEPIEIVIPTAWSPSELISESLRLLRYRYGANCKPYVSNTENVEEEEEAETEHKTDDRFFGVSGPYCPVILFKYSVIWKGREEYGQKYKQKLYLMSSAEAQAEFLSDPEKFIYCEKPIEHIPKWKICITGPIGSGRTTMSKLLAEKFGLTYINFCDFAFNCLLIPSKGNCRDLYNWLDEPGISIIPDELAVVPSETDLEFIEHLKNYFIHGLPLPTDILNNILSKLWFTEPLCDIGIVIDGFPCHPSDLETVKNHFYIPDLVIELRTSFREVNSRIYDLCCSQWKKQQLSRQKRYELEKKNALGKWIFHKTSLFTAYLIYLEIENTAFIIIDPYEYDSEGEEISETVINNDVPEPIISSPPREKSLSTAPSEEFEHCYSHVSIETRSIFSETTLSSVLPLFCVPDEEILYITSRVDETLPEPLFENEWESEESAFDRIKTRIEEWYESDMEKLGTFKDLYDEELIPWLQIDSLKRNERTLKVINKYITAMKSKNESFFEQTYVIDIDLAELLLSQGFYFLSKFGNTCPVRVFEDDSLVQMYLHDKANNSIFPVLHRAHIYFCSGNENCLEFCDNPLKYIYSSKVNTIVHLPIRIAITGPPKSGKTTLAQRFREEYGISVWSRGQSTRHVVDEFSWTSLAQQIKRHLSTGGILSNELIIKAVKLTTMDANSLAKGVVYDGFPQKTEDCQYLVESGIFPNMILNLKCSEDICLEYLQSDPTYFGNMPRLSDPFISHMFSAWSKNINYFFMTVRQNYQNLENFDGSWSKWHCWWESKKVFLIYMRALVRFLVNTPRTVVPLDKLCITQEEFEEHSSRLRDYCPTCLLNGILTRSGDPFNRIGLIQWTCTFYWFCQDHYQKFIDSPYTIEIWLPEHLPERSWDLRGKQIHENGRCIVTFSDNFPTRKIVDGIPEFAATYRDITYIFIDEQCLNKFMAEPLKYYDKVINYEAEQPLPMFDLSDLPVMGYLEQCMSEMIIKATIYTAKVRPKYPGLTPPVSAAILVGLFLKCNNPKMSADALETYQKIKDDFESMCKKSKDFLEFMNKNDNPFATKPICCNVTDTYSLYSSVSGEGSTLPSRDLSSYENETRVQPSPED